MNKAIMFAFICLMVSACVGPQGNQGVAGNSGVTGPSGSNGETPVVTQLAATSDQCQNGGDIISISVGNTDTISVICNGLNGSDGANGTSASIAQSSASSVECPNGGIDLSVTSDGVTSPPSSICNGVTGAVGPVGSQGPIGVPGANAQSVSMVQFCKGSSSYSASTFLEYGMVIGNNVYGVYSANGGFWAYLPPGYYNSNAIGSNCNFTINSNGTISN